MKKEKLITYLVLMGIVLGLPSIVYLIQNNGNIINYSDEYSYILGNVGSSITKFGPLIFAWTLLLMFIIYLKLIKNSNKFKNIKEIILTSCIVGFVFLIILPNTSKDVFFYMGNGRVIDRYGENPYFVTVRRTGK